MIRVGFNWAAGIVICAAAAWAQETACSSCHDFKMAGVHSAVSCVRCHEKHEEYPHPAAPPKPGCASCHDRIAKLDAAGAHGKAAREGGAAPDCVLCHGSAHEAIQPRSTEFRSRSAETCSACHAQAAGEFRASVHGRAVERGVARAPFCTDCHGAHSIQSHSSSASPVHPGRIRETCGSCHGNVELSKRFGLPADRLVSFDTSFHGLAAKAGGQTVANCASCHGVHNILASSDPKSTIHPANLAATCGHCHPGAGQRFAIGAVHTTEGAQEAAAVRWVRIVYLCLIPAVVGIMFLHNLGDWIRKLRQMRMDGVPIRLHSSSGEVRMLPLERFQHALLIVSFVVLAWTGFALKYPDQWWVEPILPVRSALHRASALVFAAVAFLHLISLAASARLRKHWKELWPRQRDLAEAWLWLTYNLGVSRSQPSRAAHSYIEKAEYWAVVWGAIVMIVTGWMLYANNLMLRWLPKVVLDVATAIHFYEAVLATLAIFVWHLYFVIFDPEVYPMDTAWLNGKSVRKREDES